MPEPPAKSEKVRAAPGLVSRRMAVEVLIGVESEGAYATLALNAAFKRKQISERDRAFVTALVQGVVRHRMELDQTLSGLSKQPLEKLPPPLKNILRIALFQLDQMSDIPPSAVVDTSVELAKKLGHQGQARYVNGVLRNYLRQRDKAKEEGTTNGPEQGTADGTAQQLSVEFSVPEWLVKRWIDNYGQDEATELLKFAQTEPELALRVCESAVSVEGLEKILENKDIAFHRGKLVSSCLILDSKQHGAPDKLPGFAEGLFTVQDESAAFVSLATDPKPGDLVIDLCAAPGGKALHMAELMENSGRVVAVDKHEARLNLLKKSRNRVGLTNIETVTADARTFELDKPADKVLLDAPCTGTGVINRRSDLRYRREPLDIASLTELQRELLTNAAKLVKPGGILVYSTCSIEPEENFDNMRWFLREHPEFQGDDLSPYLPDSFQQDLTNSWAGPLCKTEPEMTRLYMLQLLPSRHKVSGFFVCRLRKRT